MTMTTTYGIRQATKTEGLWRPVHWPSMARMDEGTSEGAINRILKSDGGGVRDLPRPFKFQFASVGLHDGAVTIGRLDQVTLHEDGNVEGWGWLVDSDEARKAALLIGTKAQHHNSVDLAEVEVEIDFEGLFDDGPLEVAFTKWKISSTTGVADPAFADATVELTEEITAALMADESELEWTLPTTTVTWPGMESVAKEIAASGAVVLPWDDFHIPEADEPTKIVVDEDGRVFGHLAEWDTCHAGVLDRCVVAPRGSLAGFNQTGPLTEKGQVGTGPIFLLGGHPNKPLGQRDVYEAYGGVENTWADVRVSEGRFGPWVSGRVRPGISEELVHAARCSRVSGHWVNGDLRAIVSVNSEGYRVGKGFAAFDAEGNMELVAGFAGCADDDPDSTLPLGASYTFVGDTIEISVPPRPGDPPFWIATTSSATGGMTFTIPTEFAVSETTEITVEYVDTDLDAEVQALLLELELDS